MKQIPNKTYKMKFVEDVFGLQLESILHQLYVVEEKSITPHMSDILGVDPHTIADWLKLAGLYSRRLNINKNQTIF